MFFLAPIWAPDRDDLSHPAGEIATPWTGLIRRNALLTRALPGNYRVRPIRLECPDKLQKRHRFIVELFIEAADPGEAALRQGQLPFGDSTLHATRATSTTCTSFVVDSATP